MSGVDALYELVVQAQDFDLKTRPYGNWSRVPDQQVIRLLAGALRCDEQLVAAARAEALALVPDDEQQ